LRTWAAALLALALGLVLAAPAPASTRRALQRSAFAVPTPTVPFRDAVIDHPTRQLARATASATSGQYPVNDGKGRVVTVQVSTACQADVLNCNAANPAQIATFLGTLAHGDEISQLSVLLVEPNAEVATECGSPSAQACYFPGLNQMVINGSDAPAPDGASREYVIAHEYGHHLANHRNNAPFDNPAVDWGPKNWASWAGVCPGVRDGRYFPGAEDIDHYFQNPGEAFAEAFAHNRFPADPVPWEWPDFPAPDAGAYAAIQRDALDPWNGAAADHRRGHFPRKRKRPKRKTKAFSTPLDGDLKVTLKGPDRADLSLKLLGPNGSEIDHSDGVGSREVVSYRICGERSVTAVVRRHGRRLTKFFVTGFVP
jgi:hypothetical protein